MKYVVHLVRRRIRHEETHRVVEAPDGLDLRELASAIYNADPNDEVLNWSESGEFEVSEVAGELHDVTQGPELLLASVKVDENYKVKFTR